jgi:hypothetical protein
MFQFCNYEFVLGTISRVIVFYCFGLFIVYETYFVVAEFL